MVVSNVPAQSTEVFNEVPAVAQSDWHAWWGTAVTFSGSTSMTANMTAERATKALSVPFPAGSYTLELQGTAASGVNVTPYFQSHTNWANYQSPTEAGGASQGQLGAKPWTGSQTWPITMTGSGTHFDLRMVGAAAFTVTRIIIRTANATSTTSTTTTAPSASGVELINEVPAVASSSWHAWWGTAVSFAGTTSMTANTTAERSTGTVTVPAGTYTLELQGTAASGVNVTPYFQTHTNW